MRSTTYLFGLAALVLGTSSVSSAAEICGNGIDDDANGLTDDGCYPSLTTGVCESPLSCDEAGAVSWSTGSLHYTLPPDIAPHVPYGPGISFSRIYTSMYTPGSSPASVNKTPLGPGWQHNYLTWVNAPAGATTAVLHTPTGRDVLYTKTSTDGTYDYFTPQAGDHVLSFKREISTNNIYVQVLTGETLKYNSVGQVIEIWDTLPTPNKVLITWDSTSNGNVQKVTDASGNHVLLFTYTSGKLSTVQHQHRIAGGWTTDHTTSYSYTYSVSRDATSGWYVPANATEWTNLLEGTGIPAPTNQWGCQDFSTNNALLDSIGGVNLNANNAGGMSYRQTVSGWSRLAVKLTDNQTSYWRSSSSLCNPASSKCSMFAILATVGNGVASSNRDVMGQGDANGAVAHVGNAGFVGQNPFPYESWNGTASSSGSNVGTTVRPWILSTDPTAGSTTLTTDLGSMSPTWATGTSANGNVTLGAIGLHSQPVSYLDAAAWSGTALTSAQTTMLIDRIKNGPTQLLASVTIGGTLAQQYKYGAASNLLTDIQDGANSELMSFTYSSSTTGRVNQLSTPEGALGFDFASSRASCSGKTLLYFNKGSTTSCSADSDCGSGYLCGGTTGASGKTGSCYLAARCLTTSTVNGESVVTSVNGIGPGGGSCTGACARIMQHIWSNVSGLVNEVGEEDANTGYTSIALCTTTGSGCSTGYPKQIGYGDNDTDPTNGNYNRTVFLYYDTVFPGRIAEIRRPSDISTSASSCSYTSTTGCERTIYHYGATAGTSCLSDNQLCEVEHIGFTLDSSGNPSTSPVDAIIVSIHDTNGRISEIDGPRSGAKTLFHYYLSTDTYPLTDRLKDQVVYVDASNTLTTQYLTYESTFGLPTTIKAPSGQLTCDTYDSAFGYVASSRTPMAGQTDCSTTNSADLTTSWVRDSWHVIVHVHGQVVGSYQVLGALKQLTRPDGSCVIYTFDSKHRISQVLRRDDCLTSSSGDTQQYQYTPDSQVSEIDTYDASSTLKAKQVFTYFDGGQLQQIFNPANLSVYEGFQYDAGGRLTEVDGESALSKSIFLYNGAPGRDGRATSVEGYKTSSAFDTWSLLYSFDGDQTQVTDGDSKVTGSVYDDFGRVAKLSTPDLSNPNLGLYDVAGNLTSAIEDLGGGVNQLTHTFTYDYLNRPLVADYAGACPTSGAAHAEVQRYYDMLPSGVACPMTGGCNNLAGHLAYVETILMCSSTYNATDGSLDQFTFYSYDAAGRVVEEYIKDDTNRIADQSYTYTTDGALASMTTPSGATISWGYGSTGNNSDNDLVTSVSRSGTAVVDTVSWFPFGPLQQYNQKNTLSSTAVQTAITRNLAYRATDVSQKAGATTLFDTALTEDARGRVTARAYTGGATGVQPSYFLYDEQDRVTCETTDFKTTCPTTGTDIKNNQSLAFTNAGDWKTLLRPVAGSTGGLTNDINTGGTLYGSSHRITDVNQSDGTPAFGHTAFAYDTRGSRSSDDNTTSLTHDDRTYTYDGRRNLTNVRGQYYTGSAWHYYDVASAFDAMNRRVFKSFYDETTLKTATWFFYYDLTNRLTEVAYTPDTSAPSAYSTFQLIWLENRLVAYWQTDYPSATTSKRYVGTDETGRPIDMWNWPSSGDTSRVWAINTDAWGFDKVVTGSTVFQPILFAGQYQDRETAAYENDGVTIHRPGLALNGVRTYDPFVGSYLQVDPLVNKTWSSYGYAAGDPVGADDPAGLASMDEGYGCASACAKNASDDLDIDCVSYCETVVEMGLGPPLDYYHGYQDPYYTDDTWHSSVWLFGSEPCFDASCRSPMSSPVGPSYWYGTPYGNDFEKYAGPFANITGGDLLKALDVACNLTWAGGIAASFVVGGAFGGFWGTLGGMAGRNLTCGRLLEGWRPGDESTTIGSKCNQVRKDNLGVLHYDQ